MRIKLSSLGLVALVISLATFSAPSASAGGSCHSQTLTDETATAVALSQNCFEPTVVRVAAGDTVTWTNEDGVAHTVTGANGSFGSYDELSEGEAVSETFDSEGVFPYFCVLHPSMVGAVVVGDGDAKGDAAAAKIDKPTSDDDGMSAGGMAAIAAGALAGTAALGLVTTRVVRSRWA